jgi:hypothetical protein
MPSPFESRPKPARSAVPDPNRVLSRSAERRARERRTWVARTATTLIVLSLLLITVLIVRRDRLYKSQILESLEAYVTALNVQLGRSPYLPLVWDVAGVPPQPMPFARFEHARDAVRDLARMRDSARIKSEPTIIAWSQVLPIVLGADGRAVAVYEKGTAHVEWLTEGEFNRRMAEQEEALQKAIRDAERRPRQP